MPMAKLALTLSGSLLRISSAYRLACVKSAWSSAIIKPLRGVTTRMVRATI